MINPHEHAAACDRIGTPVLREHFDLSRQALGHWRKNGIPRTYRKAVMLLAESLGIEVPELDEGVSDKVAGRIYCLRDKYKRVIYVGYTCKTLAQRLIGLRSPGRDDQRPISVFMRDHGRDVSIDLLEELSVAGTHAYATEARWIRKMLAAGEPLLNVKQRELAASTKAYYEDRGIYEVPPEGDNPAATAALTEE